MSSVACLLSAGASHSFPNLLPSCDSSSHSSSSSLPRPSLYVTFKVLQLLKTFRKRVQTRVQSSRIDTSKRGADDFCQEFERQAFDEIDQYLGRKTVHSRRRQKKTSPELTRTTADKQTSSKSTEWLLDQINQAVKFDSHSLVTVAASEKLFLQRKKDFTLSENHLSIKELIELLVIVQELLEVFDISPTHSLPAKALCADNEVLRLDEACVANLKHLLLCLKDQLLGLLIAKLVEVVHRHVIECQRDQRKHSDDWFFEFPDARHPLSTTWPWSIRPSLAVLWGVCWMFYDHHNGNNSPPPPLPPSVRFDQNWNMVNEQGEVVADSAHVIQYLSTLQQQHHAGYYPGADFMPRQRAPRLPRNPIPHSHSSEGMATAPHFRGLTPADHSHSHPRATTGVAHGPNGLTLHGTNNTYTAAPRAYDAQAAPHASPNNWLPEEDFGTTLDIQANTYPADVNSWAHIPQQSVPEQQQQARFVYQGALPPRTRDPLTPTIRLDTDFSNNPAFQQQQPQDLYHSATSVSSAASLPHQDAFFPAQYSTHHLSPQATRFMPSAAEQREMQTPPRSPHDVALGEPNPRKRSHSVMSGGVPAQAASAGSRSGSVVSNAEQSLGEDYAERTRAFKREDPPMNADNRYICTFAPECSTLTFDRKCEWSKHMDKHDRPYRCPDPLCAKLQGFTYSGGLLRHEREVHGKHGGPKAQLMCPYEDCKRHSGKGFTRKENLNEHIRRVHQSKEYPSHPTPLKRDAADAFPGADDVETPASEALDRDDNISPALKRRRYNPGFSERSTSEGVEDLKLEIKRLRDQISEKDARLAQMEMKLEEERRNRQEEMRMLQESMRLPEAQAQGQT